MSKQSFLSIIKSRAKEFTQREAFLFANKAILNTLDQRLNTVHKGRTYAEMDQQFRAVAATLQQTGKRQDRVLILHQPGEDFITAFMGCLYAGMIAVPIYPPNPARLERTLPHFLAVIEDAQPAIVITNDMFKDAAANFLGAMPSFADVPILLSSDIQPELAESYQDYDPTSEDVAFFQYTSGSTGNPRGVILTHGNLAANLVSICIDHQYHSGMRQVSWLPPYHDLGLIAGIITPLYTGGTCFIMSPMDFLKDPNRWLQAMHWFKANSTGGPNFGYEIVTKKFRPETFTELDLSAWKIAVNGAEPIKLSTLKQFLETFEPYGFQKSTFCLSYGMSEATNMVAGGVGGTIEPRYIQRAALEKNRKIIELPNATPETRTILSCGKIATNLDVRIVDPITLTECGQDVAGEIWIKSESVGKGYWRDEAKTKATFDVVLPETNESGFLRTGDYGFIRDHQIFITGRLKDLIIIRGRNYHPEDIEQTVMQAHSNFAPGACAAFAVADQQTKHKEERLVVVQEIREESKDFSEAYIKDMLQKASIAVSEKHGIQLSELIIIRKRSIHKTGSGKISRTNNLKAWKEGTLDVLYSNKETTFITKDLPQTSTEKKLATIWKKILNVEEIERSSDFMEYGGDSMAVVELSGIIKETFDFLITPDMIYANSVLSAQARVIEQKQVQTVSMDLDKEVFLNIQLETIQQLLPASNTHKTILLTGATGFLGRYLLNELLRQKCIQKVVVLLRDKDLKQGKERLLKHFATHNFSRLFLDKLQVQYGDLARPRLGMSKEAFQQLAVHIDSIYHCGAKVDWVQPYTTLRAANVDGTRELIQLAATHRLKPLHYVSTMWVLNSGASTTTHKIYDEHYKANWKGLENGYAQSKWVAECLIFKAAKLGIPVTSHRMDFIVGSALNGIIPTNDFIARLVQDAMQVGASIQEPIHLDIIAVDYLAKAIVALGQQQHAAGTVFHHKGQEQLSTDMIYNLLLKAGYIVEQLPYVNWVNAVTSNSNTKSWPLKFFLEHFAMSPAIRNPDYSTTNVVADELTKQALVKSGIDPIADQAPVGLLFQQMVQFLESVEEKKCVSA